MRRLGLAMAAFQVVVLSGAVARAQDAPPVVPLEAPASPAAQAPVSALAEASVPAPALVTTEDGARTLAAFPRNFFRGVAGVLSPANAPTLLIGGGLAASSHALDRSAEPALEGRCVACGTSGDAMGSSVLVPAVGAVFLAGRLVPHGAFRAASYDFLQALAVDTVWTTALKYSLHRQRPNGGNFLSLPSGHTSLAFSMATVTSEHFGWKAAIPAYAAASFIGYSRLEADKHYLSDVLAGAALGIAVGRTVTRVDGGTGRRRTLSLGPAADAHGTGIGLGLTASW